jgi:hypothetical protein
MATNRTRILQVVGVGAALAAGYLLYKYWTAEKTPVPVLEYQLQELDDNKVNAVV